jgi:hypothetical protein
MHSEQNEPDGTLEQGHTSPKTESSPITWRAAVGRFPQNPESPLLSAWRRQTNSRTLQKHSTKLHRNDNITMEREESGCEVRDCLQTRTRMSDGYTKIRKQQRRRGVGDCKWLLYVPILANTVVVLLTACIH